MPNRFSVTEEQYDNIVLKCDICARVLKFDGSLGADTYSREQFIVDCVLLASEEHTEEQCFSTSRGMS